MDFDRFPLRLLICVALITLGRIYMIFKDIRLYAIRLSVIRRDLSAVFLIITAVLRINSGECFVFSAMSQAV